MSREKIQIQGCLGAAHEYLWEAYGQVREAYERNPDADINRMASQILSDMIDLLDLERKVNNSNEI